MKKFIFANNNAKNIINSKYQTKEWRKNQSWYLNGKSNECEKYQIELLQNIIQNKLIKTNERLNFETYELKELKNPFVFENGYEFTENFDGKTIIANKIFYFNLKFICDNGGAQARTLKDTYQFVKAQIHNIIKFKTDNVYFINILDGDFCYKNISKFNYLINNEQYIFAKKYIFVGSLYEFKKNKSEYM